MSFPWKFLRLNCPLGIVNRFGCKPRSFARVTAQWSYESVAKRPMLGIDTNVVVRLVVADDTEQTRRGRKLLEQALRLAGYPSRTLCLVLGSKSARRAELKDGVVLVIPSIRRLAREIARLRPYPRRTRRRVGVSPSDSGSLLRNSLFLGAIQPPQHRGQGDRQQKHHHGGVHHKSWGVPHAECRR